MFWKLEIMLTRVQYHCSCNSLLSMGGAFQNRQPGLEFCQEADQMGAMGATYHHLLEDVLSKQALLRACQSNREPRRWKGLKWWSRTLLLRWILPSLHFQEHTISMWIGWCFLHCNGYEDWFHATCTGWDIHGNLPKTYIFLSKVYTGFKTSLSSSLSQEDS